MSAENLGVVGSAEQLVGLPWSLDAEQTSWENIEGLLRELGGVVEIDVSEGGDFKEIMCKKLEEEGHVIEVDKARHKYHLHDLKNEEDLLMFKFLPSEKEGNNKIHLILLRGIHGLEITYYPFRTEEEEVDMLVWAHNICHPNWGTVFWRRRITEDGHSWEVAQE